MKCGKIVNESKHNLSRYKTAVSHCFCVYRVEHAAEVFDHAKVETYKMTCKHFFDAIKKQENDLKAKGLMKIGTGGDVFSKDFFVECSKRLLQAGDYRAALFNQTGMHTAGRMGNVGQHKTGHFRMGNDCIKIQFPLTKNDAYHFCPQVQSSCIQVLNRVWRTLCTPKYSVSRFSILSHDCCSEHRLRVS